MQSDLIFRLFYNSFFILLSIVLVGLLIITPGDAIHQAVTNNQLYNVFVIAGCYLLTFILASLIYASRLYTNRTILAAIPKTFIPVEKEDVGKGVRKMIVESLDRSALIAYQTSPRIPSKRPVDEEAPDIVVPENAEEERPGKRKKSNSFGNGDLFINIAPEPLVWGDISHRGWSSPLSPDLPNLQYHTVIQELPHLIEAKAVSLAPTDPSTNRPLPDFRAVDILQRPSTEGLRDYITRLTTLSIIPDPQLSSAFTTAYEFARFSTEPLSEHEFRHLMKLFADLLRNMTALDPSHYKYENEDNDESSFKESDIDDDASSKSTPLTLRSRSIASRNSSRDSKLSFSGQVSRSSSEGTIRTAPSRKQSSRTNTNRDSGSLGAKSVPGTPKSKEKGKMRDVLSMTRMPSNHSFARSRGPDLRSQASSSSLGSGGSVIRLNLDGEEGGLPYVIG